MKAVIALPVRTLLSATKVICVVAFISLAPVIWFLNELMQRSAKGADAVNAWCKSGK